jgi:drug/metabolite transporter (DMT)-like permease
MCAGFLVGGLFFAVVRPWWSFPAAALDDRVSLLGNLDGREAPVWLLVAWMIVLGSVVPFLLFVGALRHVAATRVSIVAMLEPVVAIVVAWAWLGEALGGAQLGGAAVVLCGVVLAQTAR